MKLELSPSTTLGRRKKKEACGPSKRLLTAIGIISTIIIGTIVFGTVTTAVATPATSILSHLTRVRRNEDPVNSTLPPERGNTEIPATDPQSVLLRAKQQQLEAVEHKVTLHNVKEPVYIWAEQVIGVEIHKPLGALENSLKLSIKYLENGKVTMPRCLSLWGKNKSGRAVEFCKDAVTGIDTRWRASTEPITNAYWSLRALCHTLPPRIRF